MRAAASAFCFCASVTRLYAETACDSFWTDQRRIYSASPAIGIYVRLRIALARSMSAETSPGSTL